MINGETVGARGTFCGKKSTDQGNDFELIPTMKMETRHSVEIQFGREYAAIFIYLFVDTDTISSI